MSGTDDTTVAFRALGTTAVLVVDRPGALGDARRLLDRELAAVDEACSRFRDDSELVALNQRAGTAQPVSRTLFEAVEVALDVARGTAGLVDPTVGTAMRLLGYDRDFATVARSGPAVTFALTPVAGWQAVELDRPRQTIRLPAGVELDLGATAKAWCADRAAAGIAAALDIGVLVSLGGDIAVAGPPPPDGWSVRICDDHAAAPDASGPVVSIRSGGLATSSTTVRHWDRGGRRLHHLIDPASGQPAAGPWRTVSVAANSCVAANAATTASIILGAEAPAWLGERRLPARLVAVDGLVTTVAGWPADTEPAPAYPS